MTLKAYSFSEKENLSANVHDIDIRKTEKLLAVNFVEMYPCTRNSGICPLCEVEDFSFFAVINDAQYLKCENCWSLFIPVSEDVITKYKDYEPLGDFRRSQRYQDISKQKRTILWQEMLFWIEYRTARYGAPLKELNVAEIGGRYNGFSEMMKPFCYSYHVYDKTESIHKRYGAVLFLGHIVTEANPIKTLTAIREKLDNKGLLFLSTRVSTGFDILSLKENVGDIFPYEAATIPSIEALEIALEKSGFDILEISTPGTLDMKHVIENKSKLGQNELFIRYLVEKADDSLISEFQRFLQKNAISSHAQLVARVNDG